MPGADTRILSAVEEARRQLLDLTFRNKLLHYRHSRRNSIDVVEERSAEVYRILVANEKAMRFAGMRSETGNPESTDDIKQLPVDYSDQVLNTRMTVHQLSVTLLRIHTTARTLLEEQGVNTLFLVLGFLRWYESDTSDQPHEAPLLLLPVTLDRTRGEGFALRHTGDDLIHNISLGEKLRQDFAIQLPPVTESADEPVAAYMSAAATAVRSKPRWVIQPDRIVLGFFSYAKFLMFKDLDQQNWASGNGIVEHPVVGPALGDGFVPGGDHGSEEDFLDDVRRSVDCTEVVDADSSQILALMDVAKGATMVVEGPPGTGKSQTITNIIAAAVATKKRVLFVSEKMAALEVVKRFLDRAGVGDACLELHSRKTTRSKFYSELRRTLELPPIRTQDESESMARADELRNRLNEYCRALHTPIAGAGFTPYLALGKLCKLDSVSRGLPKADFEEISLLDSLRFRDLLAKVIALQNTVAEIGCPDQNPFFDVHPLQLLPSDLPYLEGLLHATDRSLCELREAVRLTVENLGLPPVETLRGIRDLLDLAKLLIDMPAGSNQCEVQSPLWLIHREEIIRLVEQGECFQSLHRRYDSLLNPSAWNADADSILSVLQHFASRWYRSLVPRFRSAVRLAKALFRDGSAARFPECLEAVSAISKASEAAALITDAPDQIRALFGPFWVGIQSRWDQMHKIALAILELHSQVRLGRWPESLLQWVISPPRPSDTSTLAKTVAHLLSNYVDSHETLRGFLQPGPESRLSGSEEAELSGQATVFSQMLAAPDAIFAIQKYNTTRGLCAASGFNSLCRIADNWPEAGIALSDVAEACWYEGHLRAALSDRPALGTFTSQVQDASKAEFARLDTRLLELNRLRAQTAHRESLPTLYAAGSMGVLLQQLNRQRRQIAIRQAMEQCWQPIQAVKPVFMMSPLSIAMFLPSAGPRFDMVVFDEASQVRPADALGGLLRAMQAVVIGDSQQMPPTTFFDKIIGDVDEEDRDETFSVPIGDMESILRLMRARSCHYRNLRWHYRSRHDSLIAVSNLELYENRLVVFPHTEPATLEGGLILRHLPETVYGRGGGRTNPEEAKAVVAEVQNHARHSPELSLGVVAFSAAQQEAILRQLEVCRKRGSWLSQFENPHPDEPLFIKNLENVQGDERDVIFVSVGYGRDAAGLLGMNFGPLNKEGGERRLNVLMTRARHRCIVFSNFRADDLNSERISARGVHILKRFLAYAEKRQLDMPEPTRRLPDSPFEESVKEVLIAMGYNVHCQIGSAGYFVDLGVVDPRHPGRYLLGVECDGAQYHSARCARDRDRLRQQVLEAKGWAIHRIWSTDWFRNRSEQVRKLRAVIDIQVAAPSTRPTPRVEASPPPNDLEVCSARTDSLVPTGGPIAVAYESATIAVDLRGLPMHELPPDHFAAHIQAIVAVESPVHIDEVITRIREAAGVGRAGSRIRSAILWVVDGLCTHRRIRRSGEFLWRTDMTVPPIRSRELFPPTRKHVEFIAPEEIQQAMLSVVSRAFRIRKEELCTEALYALGFARVTADMLAGLPELADKLVRSGQLLEANNELMLPSQRR